MVEEIISTIDSAEIARIQDGVANLLKGVSLPKEDHPVFQAEKSALRSLKDLMAHLVAAGSHKPEEINTWGLIEPHLQLLGPEERAQLEIIKPAAAAPLQGLPTEIARQLGNALRPDSLLKILIQNVKLTPQQLIAHNIALGLT